MILNDSNPLEMPAAGDHLLRIIAPNVLELTRVIGKAAPPASISVFPFASCGAKANATLAGSSIATINVLEPGSGYTGAPTVNLLAPDGSAWATGDPASITANVVGGQITSYTVNDGGSGYDSSVRVSVTSAVLNVPPTTDFTVTANAAPKTVSSVHFKRRTYFAAYKDAQSRDLRILASVYLTLSTNLTPGDVVVVTTGAGHWPGDMVFSATYDANRYSPALHVNQVGYLPHSTKKAQAGYYMGSGGELNLTTASYPTFEIINASNSVVYSGSLTSRLDVGFAYSSTPYQKVLEADFSAFTTPGTYRLRVAGLGCSYPFKINEGVMMQLARTCAQGIYNQRCGVAVGLPYSRHSHNACHVALAEIPTPTASYASSWATIANNNVGGFGQEPGVPVIVSHETCLFPYVKTGTVNVSGAHHDAGDYSKYTPSVASFVHTLTFAAQSLGNAGALDNLGTPESGDNKSDLLAEAKWAADYLLKIQDNDGGFFWLCNPKFGRYETTESLTGSSVGATQVLWPKTTQSTAAAVGALAELGSSPLFRTQYGATIANTYIAAAQAGWLFLLDAFDTYGQNEAFQSLFQNVWSHDDALAYAAAALYVATGDTAYQTKLFEWFPDANKNGVRGSSDTTSTYHWSWWRQTFFWGAATRTYAFAVRSGRLTSGQVNAGYMTSCENEIEAAAQYEVDSSESSFSRNAYGTSFQYDAKSFSGGVGGYFFPLEFCFNVAVAYALNPTTTKMNVLLQNVNYLLGSNPVNQVYLSGIGQRRQRTYVQGQNFLDPWRKLPITGHHVGAISMGVPLLNDGYFGFEYIHLDGTNELNDPIFPADGQPSNKYPIYDRWTDTWNIGEEWVTGFSGAKSLAVAAMLAASTTLKDQPWVP